VSLLVADKATSPVYTGQLALDCDESQYGRGYGPCLHAATSGQLTEIADTHSETRWADYCRRAAERGARGSLSVPLPVSEQLAGALNIYVREPDAFDDDIRAAATRFAPYAAVAIANMHAYEESRNLADNLAIALKNRAVIDQAKGILIERYKLSQDQAFHTLARMSMASHRKLRMVAEDLVQTGELRGVPRPQGGRGQAPGAGAGTG
jgi:GAF domain-containing protein